MIRRRFRHAWNALLHDYEAKPRLEHGAYVHVVGEGYEVLFPAETLELTRDNPYRGFGEGPEYKPARATGTFSGTLR